MGPEERSTQAHFQPAEREEGEREGGVVPHPIPAAWLLTRSSDGLPFKYPPPSGVSILTRRLLDLRVPFLRSGLRSVM